MSALLTLIRETIAGEGPISVARYMALALGHPTLGYYRTRDPFGPEGDFVTAPEISQIFGELLGLWSATVWQTMGSPERLNLVELGPGRGTLMADALRAARIVPGFLRAITLHLVETSPVLRERQRGILGESGVPIQWHDAPDDVPGGPSLVLANEFLDALPIRQFVRAEAGWCERLIGLGPDDDLVFGLARDPELTLRDDPGPPGAVIEIGDAAQGLAAALAHRLRDGGAALLIDYGSVMPRLGDSLQALRRHRFVHPLATPGDADVTAHVDFAALGRAAAAAGASIHGPVDQADFLEALGIRVRAERLMAGADEAGRLRIAQDIARLTARETTGMGRLFKVMAIGAPGLSDLPGLPLRMGGNQPMAGA